MKASRRARDQRRPRGGGGHLRCCMHICKECRHRVIASPILRAYETSLHVFFVMATTPVGATGPTRLTSLAVDVCLHPPAQHASRERRVGIEALRALNWCISTCRELTVESIREGHCYRAPRVGCTTRPAAPETRLVTCPPAQVCSRIASCT